MNITSLLKTALPFIIGVLIGAGLTKNKYVLGILITYIIFIILFSLLKTKAIKVANAQDKKRALAQGATETINDAIEATEHGHKMGANLFDKYYKDFAFYMGISLFLSTILLMIFKMWLWALVCFLGLVFYTSFNQTLRLMREIKEAQQNDK